MKPLVVLSVAVLLLSASAFAQSLYRNPEGRFTVQVPAGWEAKQGETANEVIIRKGAVSANITVIPPDHGKPLLTVKEAIDVDQADLKKQCPTYRVREEGVTTLVGADGQYVMSTCSDAHSPAVAECSAAMTSDHVLILFYVISPLDRFYESIPVLDAIRDSLRVAGAPAAAAKPVSSDSSSDSKAVQALKRACAAGAFRGDECARRIGILLGEQAPPENRAPAETQGQVYRDPQHRFSVKVPEGWTVIPEGENGSKGVQLRNGSSWINLIPYGEAATSARDVVLQIENSLAARSHSDRKPPFGPLGLVQFFSNGLELTSDEFAGSSPDGVPVQIFIAAAGDIHGGGPFLSVQASILKDQAPGRDVADEVASSIRLQNQ